jgi:hypothetical protein
VWRLSRRLRTVNHTVLTDIAGRLVKPTGSASGFKIAVMLRNADMRPSFA